MQSASNAVDQIPAERLADFVEGALDAYLGSAAESGWKEYVPTVLQAGLNPTAANHLFALVVAGGTQLAKKRNAELEAEQQRLREFGAKVKGQCLLRLSS